MLDNSVIYMNVILVNNNASVYTKVEPPEGYTVSTYTDGDEIDWVKLMMSDNQFESFGKALDFFNQMFGTQPLLLSTRMIFIKDQNGETVATATLWPANHFGALLNRLHYFYVEPKHEALGLHRVLISALLDIFASINNNEILYITSSTRAYRDIHDYMEFGFVPYQGVRPPIWHGTVEQFDHNKVIAWNMIAAKIKLIFPQFVMPHAQESIT